ncbi:MAG: hypothetical protein GW839_14135 [Flavobacteriales bacterium]|nr:hypothetical protein [Flavobacteriales bacterium]PIQ17305.1 MAG: hypothetical protein COW66_12545 [Flavobacteriaceae bacterium CG18_big_fil_WC_8_21_14_2_50_34_36]
MEKKTINLKSRTIEQAFIKDVKFTFTHLKKISNNVKGYEFDSFYSLAGFVERAISVFLYETNIYQNLSEKEKYSTYDFFMGFLRSLKKMNNYTEIYNPTDFLNQCTECKKRT